MANETNGSKSPKYNDAVARATGNDAANPGTAIKPIPGISAMITEFKPDDIAALSLSGNFEFAPQNIKLEPGSAIEGVLDGRGPDAEFADDKTGEVRVVCTWIIMSPDGSQRAALLGSAQLDRKLPPFVGGFVKIFRGKDIALAGGHRCGDYMVGGTKLADGTKRVFVQPPKMIEVTAGPAVPQLAAGEHVEAHGTAHAAS